MSTATALPRTAVRLQLQAWKAPVALAQRLAGAAGQDTWPPMLAFESFEAGVKQLWGKVLRDEQLSTEAEVLAVRVAKLREAAELAAKAEGLRKVAAAEEKQRKAAAERLRKQGEQADAKQEAAAKQRAEEAERRIAEAAREAKAEARRQEEERRRQVATTERTADRIALHAESSALDEKAEALQAERIAESVDKALERKKTARKVS